MQVDFNETFIDIQSIKVSGEGTSPLIVNYAFEDIPNPTHFHIYVYDTSGNYVDNQYVSWDAKGA
jgi:hypothetical protein